MHQILREEVKYGQNAGYVTVRKTFSWLKNKSLYIIFPDPHQLSK